jgi:transcriptional regulator with XRE-family HTH domain
MTTQRSKRDTTLATADLFDLPDLGKPAKESIPAAPTAPTTSANPEKEPRKSFKIFHTKKAKLHRNYTREEVMEYFGVTRNTVTNWEKEGLIKVPDYPVLYRGEDLNEFHEARRAGARRNCSPGQFLCFHCKKVSSLKAEAAKVHWHNDRTCTLRWSCPRTTCGKPNETYQSRTQIQMLDELGVNLTSNEDDYSPSRNPGEVVQIRPNSEVIDEPVK